MKTAIHVFRYSLKHTSTRINQRHTLTHASPLASTREKAIYGRSFTTEHVEDVKTFLTHHLELSLPSKILLVGLYLTIIIFRASS